MKIIHHINGVVVDIINARHDVAVDSIVIVDRIPDFAPRNGYNGVLKYNENGLYWDYEEHKETEELSSDEALNIILGGEV